MEITNRINSNVYRIIILHKNNYIRKKGVCVISAMDEVSKYTIFPTCHLLGVEIFPHREILRLLVRPAKEKD